jgi:predicted SnoaL-like aldol condensation-catalyzing enzyme
MLQPKKFVILPLMVALAIGSSLAHTTSTSNLEFKNKGATNTLEQQEIWMKWQNRWNGNYAIAKDIISSNFRIHAALMDGSPDTSIHGAEGLVNWMAQSASIFESMKFTTLVGPIIDGNLIAGRWMLVGVYKGGVPGAKAAPGMVAGTDILRVENGKILEYWRTVNCRTNPNKRSLSLYLKLEFLHCCLFRFCKAAFSPVINNGKFCRRSTTSLEGKPAYTRIVLYGIA